VRSVVSRLLQRLPASSVNDPLLALGKQASHQSIRVRKKAIDQAAALLQRGEQREEVLAILEHLARNDLMNGVREQAQASSMPTRGEAAPVRSQDSRHRFGARCQNGHISYFDKREVCAAKRPLELSAIVSQRQHAGQSAAHRRAGGLPAGNLSGTSAPLM